MTEPAFWHSCGYPIVSLLLIKARRHMVMMLYIGRSETRLLEGFIGFEDP
jgi:hypothetical protein